MLMQTHRLKDRLRENTLSSVSFFISSSHANIPPQIEVMILSSDLVVALSRYNSSNMSFFFCFTTSFNTNSLNLKNILNPMIHMHTVYVHALVSNCKKEKSRLKAFRSKSQN